jgi:hypothetical protein
MYSNAPALGARTDRFVTIEDVEGDVLLAEGLREEEAAEAGAEDQDVGTSDWCHDYTEPLLNGNSW